MQLPPFFIEGRYGLEPIEDTRPERPGPGEPTLLGPVIRLLQRPSPLFVSDFFNGLRIVLIGTHGLLRAMITASERALEEEADRWAKTAAAAFGDAARLKLNGGQPLQPQPDDQSGDDIPAPAARGRPRKLQPAAAAAQVKRSNLELWNISRATDDKIETMQDRRIIYLIERVTSLRETLQSVNRLFGPKRRIDATVGRRGLQIKPEILKQEFAAFEQAEPLFADGLGNGVWDAITATGIYLLYDYDYDMAIARDPPPPELKSETLKQLAEKRLEWLEGLKSDLERLDGLTGLVSVKNQIGGIIQTLLVNPIDARAQFLNLAITGDPGTGKTEVAKLLPGIFYRLGYAPRPYPTPDQIPITTKPDWIAPYEGQSAAQAKLTMLRFVGRMGIIDEAYSLVTDDADGFGKESLSQIVSDLDDLRGLVIIAVLGYAQETQEMFQYNPGLARRFPYRIDIEPYTHQELYTILMNRLESTGIAVPPPLRLSADMIDLFEELAKRGAFSKTNAAAMSTIVGLYRTTFAIERFALATAAGGEQSIRVDEVVAEERLLLAAVRKFARAEGFKVVERPETPPLPRNPVTFATPLVSRRDPESRLTTVQPTPPPGANLGPGTGEEPGGIRAMPGGFGRPRARATASGNGAK